MSEQFIEIHPGLLKSGIINTNKDIYEHVEYINLSQIISCSIKANKNDNYKLILIYTTYSSDNQKEIKKIKHIDNMENIIKSIEKLYSMNGENVNDTNDDMVIYASPKVFKIGFKKNNKFKEYNFVTPNQIKMCKIKNKNNYTVLVLSYTFYGKNDKAVRVIEHRGEYNDIEKLVNTFYSL